MQYPDTRQTPSLSILGATVPRALSDGLIQFMPLKPLFSSADNSQQEIVFLCKPIERRPAMSISLISGMVQTLNAYQERLNKIAQNTANVLTEGYRPIETVFREDFAGGVRAETRAMEQEDIVDLSREMTDKIAVKAGHKAVVSIIKTGQEMMRALLDIHT
jgi:flagellar hook protein FlgE